MEKRPESIVSLFAITGTVESVSPLGEGLINDTFLVTTAEADAPGYVLQRINTSVFPDVDMVMRNIEIVTTHIRHKLARQGEEDLAHRVLRFLPQRENRGKLYAEVDGEFWRLMVYIDHALTKNEVNADSSYAAGLAFGDFQKMLADVPYELGETIPDFHNMEFRLQQLQEAVSENRAGRLQMPEVQELLHNLLVHADEMTKAEKLFRKGKLPKRICHCDTKVNNMLFTADGTRVLCVIDLDTVMPSFIFSDYGDFLRTAANTVAEDEPDFSLIQFRMDIFEAFTCGYLESTGSFLTPMEKDMLPFAVKLFPYMQSVRFLWDVLNGDHYWKCSYPTHNLVRAQNQYHLFKRIEEREEELINFIKNV